MNIPNQAAPVARQISSTNRSNSRQRGIEASRFDVAADRIQGGGGDFRNCKCSCLTAQRSVDIGGPDGVSFFRQVDPIVIGNRPISDNNNV
jgi:hypothetical protein